MNVHDLANAWTAIYLRTWGIALSRLPAADGWLLVACLIIGPLLGVWAIRLLAWFLVDTLTFGALSRRDAERFAARQERRSR